MRISELIKHFIPGKKNKADPKRKKDIGYLAPQYWDAVVYSEKDKIPAIDNLINKYKQIAKNIQQPVWYDKYASIYFTYNDSYYRLTPAHIDASNEVFGCLANNIMDELYNLGAYDMFNSTMLD